jgi:hypothetical protein
VSEARFRLTEQRLTTPRSAAIAGILFALLQITSQVLIRLSVPPTPGESGGWLETQAGTVSLALRLVPFAGIAFLWFIGVIRDRLGKLEDQFFATVVLGSGVLYLGLTFVNASLAGGLLAAYAVDPGIVSDTVYTYARLVMYQISSVTAARMAGVFMISLGTIWLRTGVMPRWVAFVTYVMALASLLSVNLSLGNLILFPVWVFFISLLILVWNYRRAQVALQPPPEA